jgi:hypothetical protein
MKNTEYQINAVDSIAFVSLFEMYNYGSSLSTCVHKIDNNKLIVRFDRYSMDCNGYHNGYEKYYIEWQLFPKNLFNIFGIPTSIFKYFIVPKAFEIKRIVGAERSSARYMKSDDDFVYQEIENWLDNNLPNLEEATFDPDNRCWSIGYFTEYLDKDPVPKKKG